MTGESEAERAHWECFHCGFATSDPKEAAAHFGDRDDAEEFKPLCRWWNRMSPEERGDALQDVIQQLNEANEEARLQGTKIEGLEYRLLDFESLVGSRFKCAKTINDAFNQFDSMEGRALAAEESRDTLTAALQQAREALRAAESIIEKSRDRFKHIAADTSPEGYGGGHERVCYNATCGQRELDADLARIAEVLTDAR